jgi:uncharacterized damage-inducible protein DinB
MRAFAEWLLIREFAYDDMFLANAFSRVAEKLPTLPPAEYGKVRIRFTGNLEQDLNALADVDTAYLDKLYREMNKTGRYSGNNEILRRLYTKFLEIKSSHDQGVPMQAAQIETQLGRIEDALESASLALDQLEHTELAEFYGGPCSTLAMAVKQYAVKHLSQKH